MKVPGTGEVAGVKAMTGERYGALCGAKLTDGVALFTVKVLVSETGLRFAEFVGVNVAVTEEEPALPTVTCDPVIARTSVLADVYDHVPAR